MYYLHRNYTDMFGNEHTIMNKKASKTYDKALNRAKKMQNALIVHYPNNPVSLIRNGIEVLHA